ncbi:MAG: class I SAM-dependent methyltransferase [Burkholderiaceae bacterium]
MPQPLSELDRWNDRYGGSDYWFGTAPNAFLMAQHERLAPGLSALCIADGEGRNSVWLAEQGLAVTAFDFSPVGCAKATRLAAEHDVQVDLRVADVDGWDWQPDCYDVVAAIFVQFATPAMRERLFNGIVRTLKPRGLLILQGYRTEQIAYGTGGPKQVEHLYTEALLREHFKSLDILNLASRDAVIEEGPGHSGTSALIDLVARKPH